MRAASAAGSGPSEMPVRRSPSSHSGRALEEGRPRGGEEHEGSLHLVREVLHEVEQRLLRPVRIVEVHHERPLAPEGLEQPADPPEELGELVRSSSERPISAATRSATSSSSPPAVASELGARRRHGSSPPMPAASRRISTIGRNVMPSP